MNNKKLEFLKQAFEVYMKFGIKSVTMDELARQLSMSKKTIYTFVKDKNDLVEQCVMMAQDIETKKITSISKEHTNAIDELLAIGEQIVNKLTSVHPSIFFDMQKYHPNSFKLMTCDRDELMNNHVVANLIKGKKQGLYRENLDEIIISKMHLSFISVLFSGEFIQDREHTFSQVYSEYFRYHIRGIASDKGLAYLQEIMKTKKIDI